MVKTINLKTDIPADHELRITLPEDVPTGPAEIVLIVVPEESKAAGTFADFAKSEFFGMWKDRTDIEDSADFARRLRDESWKRSA